VFHRVSGSLFIEAVRLSRLLSSAAQDAGIATPFYVYSREQLRRDYSRYAEAAASLSADLGTPPVIAFAVKANPSRALIEQLHGWGAGATVVSAGELALVRSVGIPGEKILLHGNGKRRADIDAALDVDAMLSLDSEFDLQHVQARARARGQTARVLLRVNPNIDPQVHPYISTGLLESKFGMAEATIERLRPLLRELARPSTTPSTPPPIALRGLHCHLGSTLKSGQPVLDAARQLLPLLSRLRSDGHSLDTLDLGGGLGIDYSHRSGAPAAPSPAELMAGLRLILQRGSDDPPLRLWFEPGRSIVGPCGALIGRVIGVKHRSVEPTASEAAGERSFLCTDASMAQLIRPCLYGAYHHIELLEEPEPSADAQLRLYDVVGPICESGDFIGQKRLLPTPREGDGLIIYDAGAYGAAMASRYNLHFQCAEYLIDGSQVTRIRRAETFDDFARTFVNEPLAAAEEP
jgi:diaminopimelate decarboxylase